MKKSIIFALFVSAISFYSCDKNDVAQETTLLNNNDSLSKQSTIVPEVYSMHIDNGIPSNCANNILVFPSWDVFYGTAEHLDDAIDIHCDAFENSADPNLTDEEFEAFSESQGFDEDKPLDQFETDLEFCSLWRKLYNEETDWLSMQGDGEWDASTDPDNHFIDEESERVLYNTGVEVMIGNRKDGYIIYKIFEWGIVEIHNNDYAALAQINTTGVIPTNNPNVVVVEDEVRPEADCHFNRHYTEYFHTGGNTKIKTNDKMKDFNGAPGPSKSSKFKAKTKYYRKKGGAWRRGKTTLTAGFEGTYNRLSYFQEPNNCGEPFNHTESKTRKRSKIKIKHKGDAESYFRVEDNLFRGVHKRREDVIKKIDYYDGDVQ